MRRPHHRAARIEFLQEGKADNSSLFILLGMWMNGGILLSGFDLIRIFPIYTAIFIYSFIFFFVKSSRE